MIRTYDKQMPLAVLYTYKLSNENPYQRKTDYYCSIIYRNNGYRPVVEAQIEIS